MGGVIFLFLLWVAVGGGVGYWIGSGKGRGGLGFVLGLLFGVIGWLIVALLQPTVDVEERRIALLAAAVHGDEFASANGRPCPWCAEIIKPAASVCRYCNREVQPVPAATTNASAARSESFSGDRISGPSSQVHTNWGAVIDQFGVSSAKDFDPTLMEGIERPLHILNVTIQARRAARPDLRRAAVVRRGCRRPACASSRRSCGWRRSSPHLGVSATIPRSSVGA